MMGRVLVILLVACTVLAGGGMYYLQVYAYYDRLPPVTQFEIATAGGPALLPARDFQGIDSQSSPLRYRACMTLDLPEVDLIAHANPTPLNAPHWFDCFDAARLGADLDAGTARAVLVVADFRYGFDRVMALYPDGRAFVWPQVNACGTAHFDGKPLPAGCPTPPAR
jgi:hypothetical protein